MTGEIYAVLGKNQRFMHSIIVADQRLAKDTAQSRETP